MKIGYPCANRSIGCSPSRTFDLRVFSRDHLILTIAENLSCIARILEFNRKAGLYFFVIGPGLIPYATHPANTLIWAEEFAADFAAVGAFIRDAGMRIAVQPSYGFAVPEGKGEREAAHAATILDAMELGTDAKVIAWAGGGPGRESAQDRTFKWLNRLPDGIRRRIAIRNDDTLSVADCCAVAEECGVPVVYDHLHRDSAPSPFSSAEAIRRCAATWHEGDGAPILVFATPEADGRPAHTIDADLFAEVLAASMPADPDIVIDFQDREQSALIAMIAAFDDPRLIPGKELRKRGA
ncbi:apurinic/apyrimidinic endonuclease family protein [Methanofollis tationis]|nr:UV DNA damage repair endonuclease UvsE [Methanofollis tationis]